jgi:hypothetical protein
MIFKKFAILAITVILMGSFGSFADASFKSSEPQMTKIFSQNGESSSDQGFEQIARQNRNRNRNRGGDAGRMRMGDDNPGQSNGRRFR